MDRFDDSRNSTRKLVRGSRDTRFPELDKEGSTTEVKKSVSQLINEAAELENSFRKDYKDSNIAGATEKSNLLSLAQREDLFNRKCLILEAYRKNIQNAFSQYRKMLNRINDEKITYGKQQYSAGYEAGKSVGSKREAEKLAPVISEYKRKIYLQRIVRGVLILYSITSSILFALAYL